MITLIPPEEVPNVWGDVAPLLQMAVDRAPGRYDVVDILTNVMQREAQLWIGFDEDQIHAACVSRMYDTPLARVFSVQWLGGNNIDKWLADALEVTKRFAQDHGCTVREIVGRDGWGRLTGMTKMATIFQEAI